MIYPESTFMVLRCLHPGLAAIIHQCCSIIFSLAYKNETSLKEGLLSVAPVQRKTTPRIGFKLDSTVRDDTNMSNCEALEKKKRAGGGQKHVFRHSHRLHGNWQHITNRVSWEMQFIFSLCNYFSLSVVASWDHRQKEISIFMRLQLEPVSVFHVHGPLDFLLLHCPRGFDHFILFFLQTPLWQAALAAMTTLSHRSCWSWMPAPTLLQWLTEPRVEDVNVKVGVIKHLGESVRYQWILLPFFY